MADKLNIKKAIKHPGALTESARRAGMSPMAFAEKHKHDSGKTGQRARFALTLRGPNVAGKQKHKKKSPYHGSALG